MREVRRVNQTIKGRLITFVVRAAKTSSIKTRSNMPRTGDKVPGSPRKFHFNLSMNRKRLRRAAFSFEREKRFSLSENSSEGHRHSPVGSFSRFHHMTVGIVRPHIWRKMLAFQVGLWPWQR